MGFTDQILHADTFGELTGHQLNEDFGWSDDPVWPHSTRRHVLYAVEFTDATDPLNKTTVTRVYLHDVKTGGSRVVGEDPYLDLVWRYDFQGSANTGVDRLFEDEGEEFVVAWDATTGAPLLDVTAVDYPPIDTAAQSLAALVPLPAGLMPMPWPTIQVVE